MALSLLQVAALQERADKILDEAAFYEEAALAHRLRGEYSRADNLQRRAEDLFEKALQVASHGQF